MASRRTRIDGADQPITLEDFYAAAALTGILSAQTQEPAKAWVVKFATQVGEKMAAAARARRGFKLVKGHAAGREKRGGA